MSGTLNSMHYYDRWNVFCALVHQVVEKLYRARWGPEDGVGCIIMSPTRELASQLFEVLKGVGKHHGFSAGLLIGGRKDVDAEKERVNDLNILVCTPGRLLQHMDETPNFECSQLQVFHSTNLVVVFAFFIHHALVLSAIGGDRL